MTACEMLQLNVATPVHGLFFQLTQVCLYHPLYLLYLQAGHCLSIVRL